MSESLPSIAMRGLTDLDIVCMKEIFLNLTPLELSSMQQCNKRLRDLVDDHLHSLYFVRKQCLELTEEHFFNADKILKSFGKFVSYLKVRELKSEPWCKAGIGIKDALDVIADNCSDILKGLTLSNLQRCNYKFDMLKFVGVFENLEILELMECYDRKCNENILLEHEYQNLTTLRVKSSNIPTEVLNKFFMRKRNIKKLSCRCVCDEDLRLIALNTAELEDLDIMIDNKEMDVMILAQFRKLKRLKIDCQFFRRRPITALIKEFSANTDLEMIGIYCFLDFDDEFCDALSNLINLKELRLKGVGFTLNGSTSIEMLSRKLLKLKSLMVWSYSDFPIRNFLASFCKSDIFREIYVPGCNVSIINSLKQVVKESTGGRGDSCFVPGSSIRIYVSRMMFDSIKEEMFNNMNHHIKCIGNENIKIFPDDALRF